ncbi:hypothetical protein IPH92_01785 [Candidatus Kaiserbacteria bacterium]|nr:MAG: hypothetical protein IPH92_01785 [Candidatus Kaiserbacteria bacterium]
MREQFEQKKSPEQQVAETISLVEGELADGPLYSKEHRDDLLAMLVTALTITSDARARAKINELMDEVMN